MKTVLITGGRGEIGQAIIAQFRKADYQIIAPTREDLDLNQPAVIEDEIIKQVATVDQLFSVSRFF